MSPNDAEDVRHSKEEEVSCVIGLALDCNDRGKSGVTVGSNKEAKQTRSKLSQQIKRLKERVLKIFS